MLDVAAALNQLLAQPIAHRGLHGCGRGAPVENSLGAAEAAVAAGYAIECDVQASRDSEAIVFHDASLDRLTGASGLVASHDAATLRALALRDGTDRIPTLADLLATIDSRVPLVIEIKSEGGSAHSLVARILALLGGYAGAVALESFDPAIVMLCRTSGIARPVGLVAPPERGEPIDRHALETSDFLSWSIDGLNDAAQLQPRRPLTTWTVRSEAQEMVATRHGAQIVFEGFRPSPSVNRDREQ